MKKVLSLCVFCVFLLSLAGSCGIGAEEGEGEIIEVVIEADKTFEAEPRITVSPYSLGANHNDIIVWKSECPFAIHFGSSSPVNGLVFWGMSKEESMKADPKFWEPLFAAEDWGEFEYVATTKVVHNPKISGGMKAVYYIAFYDKDDNKVGVIDPDIVVPPKGGGPGGR